MPTVWSALSTAAGIDLAIQGTGFTVAALLKTEYFYDALGSATFIALALHAYRNRAQLNYGSRASRAALDTNGTDKRQRVVTGMVLVWAIRLGSGSNAPEQ
eukprot:gene7854-7283_t